jgi:hypothetical protein
VTIAPEGPVASAVIFVGCDNTGNNGAGIGCTIILNDLVAAFPYTSLAVHDTVVVPTGNVEPEEGIHEIVGVPRLAVAVTVYVTTVPITLVAVVVMSAGTVKTGGIVDGGVAVIITETVLSKVLGT